MFEYLMPLLRDAQLSGNAARRVVPHGGAAADRLRARRAARRGASPSRAYTAVDRLGNYQYKAFGVPGLGLKRGLGDELVVAPYATALAVLIDPARSARNLRRLADVGLLGELRLLRIDRLHRSRRRAASRPTTASVVRAFFAHHAGMSLVALANAVTGDRMIERFHADPRVRATELLLQERVPRQQPVTEPRPLRRDVRHAAGRERAAAPLPHAAHGVSAHAVPVERQVRRRRSPTPAAAPASTIGMCVTRSRRDATLDPGSHFIYLRDIRSGAVWSPTFQPDAARAERYPATFLPGHRDVRLQGRGDRDAAGDRRVAGARRRSARACSSSTTAIACARSTSPVTSRWRSRRRATISRIRRSASCSSRPSSSPNAAR